MNIFNKFKLTYLIFLYVIFALSSLFDRSFMGIYIFGFRIGEIIVGLFLIQSLFVFLLNKKTTDALYLKEFSGSLKIYKIIIFTFLLSLLYFQTSLTSTYTYKTSSYIWLASIIYISYYLHQSNNFSLTIYSKFIYLYATFNRVREHKDDSASFTTISWPSAKASSIKVIIVGIIDGKYGDTMEMH